jgi:hypothetical protein
MLTVIPTGRQFACQAARPADLAAFGRGVSGKRRDASVEHFAGDADDPAPALGFHAGQRPLGHQERTFDEKVDHPLVERPIVLLEGF